MSVVVKAVLLLALTAAQAGCGARTSFDGSPNDGAAPPGLFGGGGSSSTPMAPTSLPCTGSYPSVTGDAERDRTGPCRWNEAEPADLAHPDLKFTLNEKSIPLALLDGPSGCDAVSGRGWYLVANVPGVIVEAPVVMTFEVCPAACREIAASAGWLLSFNVNTCR